ncbi:hypothetical protein [Methylopila sp. M107]|uniref:hypothetical protein n=1 Tax=Methylopila sp. M107 TaxID=1101190 RepID=UPI00037AFDEF|nr:hypothetical protein [Methylopila sp. M107]
MRLLAAALAFAIAPFAAAAPAGAVDAPRDRVYAPRAYQGPAYYRPTETRRRIVIEKRADRRMTVVDTDGVVLHRSFVDPEPPRRVETRSYVRDDRRRPFALYGGFFGPGRWGYSRDGW